MADPVFGSNSVFSNSSWRPNPFQSLFSANSSGAVQANPDPLQSLLGSSYTSNVKEQDLTLSDSGVLTPVTSVTTPLNQSRKHWTMFFIFLVILYFVFRK